MSKRLLMNNCELKPVKDGLVCWLDGRDYISGENIWRDRSKNGKDAHLSSKSGKNRNNALLFKGHGNIENPTLNLQEYTIEVKFTNLLKGYWNGIFGNTSNNTGGSLSLITSDSFCLYPNGIELQNIIKENKGIHFTIIYKSNTVYIYLNGVNILKQNTVIKPSTAKYFVICARKPNNATDNTDTSTDGRLNEWYSFKIYNRALSEKEIQQNYVYEQSIDREPKWDYEKTSTTPIPVQELWKECFDGRNINLNTFSNNQILEVDISEVDSGSNDPQIMLLCDKDIGGKVYWSSDDNVTVKMGNNPNFALKLNYPTKLKVPLINNTFSFYVNDILQESVKTYPSAWLQYAGIQINSRRMLVTGIRYKKIE